MSPHLSIPPPLLCQPGCWKETFLPLTTRYLVSNAQVSAVEGARAAYKTFETEFNRAFAEVEQFECQKNPYHPHKGDTKLVMHENQGLIWSFGSKSQDPNGNSLPESYVTMATMEHVVDNFHNNLVTKPWGFLGAREGAAGAAAGGEGAAAATPVVPLAVHRRTPLAQLRRQTIDFSLERDLMPLLHVFSDGGGGGSNRRHYDLGRIDAVLKRQVLRGRPTLDVAHIQPYGFKGEASAAGGGGSVVGAEAGWTARSPTLCSRRSWSK